MMIDKLALFLVVLGGRSKSSHIELHDVRWVLGHRIEDTFDQLRKEWFADSKGLHIDSYTRIDYVDGYRILFEPLADNNQKLSSNSDPNNFNYSQQDKLWFINLGGYDPCSFNELHEFGLIVSNSSSSAVQKAKNRWLNGKKFVHKDDLVCISKIRRLEKHKNNSRYQTFKTILLPMEKEESYNVKPTWYGYLRIDNK